MSSVIIVPQPAWQLIFQGANVTQHVESQTMEVRWTDRLGGQAAEMSFTVEDSQRRWQKTPPSPTDQVGLMIGYKGAPLFDCGTFTIDEFELSGPPDVMTIRAIENWTTAPIRTPISYGFEGLTLSQIARSIASRHGWTAITTAVQPDVVYQRVTQNLETDLEFLRRVANQHNYDFNIRPPNLIFYSRPALEAAPPNARPITRKDIMRFRLSQQTVGERTYGGAQISYLDPMQKKLLSGQANAVGTDPTADTLNYVERLENNQQASLKVASVLHEHNMLQFQGTLDMPGTIMYRAGSTVTLAGEPGNFGQFAGVYIVEEAEHVLRARSGGYTTRLQIRTAEADSTVGPAAVPSGLS